jgi:hypothetical protein
MSLRGIEAQPKDDHPSPTVCLDPDSKKDQLLSQDSYRSSSWLSISPTKSTPFAGGFNNAAFS